MQSAALFPLQFLLGFANGLFYFHLALELIAGLATYYFLRRLRCNRAAAMLGAAAFAINGTFAWITHTIFNPIAFLPLMLLGVEIALQAARDKQRRGWFILALSIVCTTYAGFPETGFINGMFAGLWAIVRMTTLSKGMYWPFVRKLLIAGGVGLALSAPLLIAFAGYLHHANVGLHESNTAKLILPMLGLPGLVMPYIYGPIFANWGYDTTMTLYKWWASVGGFISLTFLLTAFVGMFAKGFRRLDRGFLLGWIIFCVFASYGILGFNYIAGNIPLLSLAAFCRYLPPVYIMAIIMLAAMGLTQLWNNRGDRTAIPRKVILLVGGGTILLAAIAALFARTEYHRLLGAPSIKYWFYGSIVWGLGSLIVLTLCMLWPKKVLARIGVAIVLLADVTIMYAIPMFSAPRKATIDVQPVSFLRQNLDYHRFYSLGPIQPNYGSYFKIPSVNINDIPQPQLYSDYITEKLDPNVNPITFTGTNFLDPNKPKPLEAFLTNMKAHEFIGVKYLITFPNALTIDQARDAGLTLAFRDNVAEIYELPNPKSLVTVEKGDCDVTIKGWDEFTANCSQESTIVRRVQFIEGWTAKVDGKAVPINVYAKLFQEIKVPAGQHTVTYVYEPPHVKLGYVAAFLGLVIIGVGYRQNIRRVFGGGTSSRGQGRPAATAEPLTKKRPTAKTSAKKTSRAGKR